jgi:hypothetical protein
MDRQDHRPQDARGVGHLQADARSLLESFTDHLEPPRRVVVHQDAFVLERELEGAHGPQAQRLDELIARRPRRAP